ncbi:IS110 family transposase, partial [Streptomyces vietnamensis]
YTVKETEEYTKSSQLGVVKKIAATIKHEVGKIDGVQVPKICPFADIDPSVFVSRKLRTS